MTYSNENGTIVKLVWLVIIAVCLTAAATECWAQHPQAPSAPTSAADATPSPPPATSEPWFNGERCVQNNQGDIRNEIPDHHATGPSLVNVSYFLAAGSPFKVAIDEGFDPNRRYFAFARLNSNNYAFAEGADVSAVQIPSNDPLVQQNVVQPSATLLTLRFPASVGGYWQNVNVYVWYCNPATRRPAYMSKLTIRASSPYYSAAIAIIVVALLYIWAAGALSRKAVERRSWFSALDPVYITAGSDGKGSLSKLQILFFAVIIFGLLTYIVFRTGVLSNISPSILYLLGIAAIGSAVAKGTDEQKNTLSFDNRSWLIRKGWLPPGGFAAVNVARWRDLITNDNGEFDVYRYQSCIFSLTVGAALLVGGVSELASFTIPDTLLGILGLSQGVYISGKVVTKSPIGELDDALDALRDLEKKFIDAWIAAPDPDPSAGGSTLAIARRRAGDAAYIAYLRKAEDVRNLFQSLTDVRVDEEKVQPQITI